MHSRYSSTSTNGLFTRDECWRNLCLYS